MCGLGVEVSCPCCCTSLLLVLTAGRVQPVLSLAAQWRGGAHFCMDFRGTSHKIIWFCLLFSWDNSPIFNDGSWGERRYYCIPEHHAQPEKWSVISLLVKMALCVQDPPNRNTNALLIPVISVSGVQTIKSLPWAKAHNCPCRWLPVGSHQPGCALPQAVLATQRGQQDVAG